MSEVVSCNFVCVDISINTISAYGILGSQKRHVSHDSVNLSLCCQVLLHKLSEYSHLR